MRIVSLNASESQARAANRARLSAHATRTDFDGMDGYHVRKQSGGKRRKSGENRVERAMIARIRDGQ
jgi:hypothetical protein